MIEKEFTYSGVTTRCMVLGQGQPLLFLSGGGVSAGAYMPLLRELSRDFLVIAPDLPGFGHASTPETVWSLTDFAEYIEALLKSFGHTGVYVAAHSLGGGIALELAKRGGVVSSLVLVSPAGQALTMSETRFRWRYFVGKTFYDLVHYRNALPVLFLLGWDFMLNRLRRGCSWGKIVASMRTCLFSGVTELTNITVPVLFITPDRDELFSRSDIERFAADVPGARVEVVSGNHDWILFRSRDCASLAREWFLGGVV